MRARGRPSQARTAEIGDAIVAATIDAFTHRGMAFLVDDVAEAAGISKQAIYRRWSGKRELLIFAVESELARVSREATGGLPDDPREALKEVAWRIFNTDRGRHNRMSVTIQVAAFADGLLLDKLLGWRRQVLRVFIDRLEPIVNDEEVAFDLAAILQDLLAGAGAVLGWEEAGPVAVQETFGSRWNAFLAVLDTRLGTGGTAFDHKLGR